jgi:hypothetical protein
VERVRHDDTVKAVKVQRSREIRDESFDAPLESAQCLTVLVHGDDVSARAQQLGEREREGAFAGPEVGPAATPFSDAVLNQRDVIGVIQLRP